MYKNSCKPDFYTKLIFNFTINYFKMLYNLVQREVNE